MSYISNVFAIGDCCRWCCYGCYTVAVRWNRCCHLFDSYPVYLLYIYRYVPRLECTPKPNSMRRSTLVPLSTLWYARKRPDARANTFLRMNGVWLKLYVFGIKMKQTALWGGFAFRTEQQSNTVTLFIVFVVFVAAVVAVVFSSFARSVALYVIVGCRYKRATSHELRATYALNIILFTENSAMNFNCV